MTTGNSYSGHWPFKMPYLRYAMPVLAVSIAAAASVSLPFLDHAPFPLFFGAVVVSAWFGGFAPGILATTLSLTAAGAFVVPSVEALVTNFGNLTRFGLFAVVAILTTALIAGLRNATQREAGANEWYRFVFFSSSPDAMIVVDAKGRVISMNREAEALTGWISSQASSRPIDEVLALLDAETRTTIRAWGSATNSDGFLLRTLRRAIVVARDGTQRWVDARTIADPEKAPGCGAVLVLGDASKTRRLEGQLRRSEKRLENFLEDAAIGFHWVAADGTILRANHAALDLLGYSHEEFVGHSISEFHANGSVSSDFLERLRRGETLHDFEAGLRARDGSTRHVLIDSNVRWKDGEPARSLCCMRDVTDRKRAEEVLRFLSQSSSKLAASVDYETTLRTLAELAIRIVADCCIIEIVDANGKVRGTAMASSHPAPLDLHEDGVGRSTVENGARGSASEEASHDDESPSTRKGEHSSMDAAEAGRGDPLAELGGQPSRLVVPLVTRGRSIGTITFVAEQPRRYGAAELSVADEFARWAAVAIDNAFLHDDARDADRRKDEFLAALAHELRNPLAPIRNSIHVLRSRTDPASMNQALDMLERQTHHLTRLTDDLLDVARITCGRIQLQRELLELNAIVNRVVESIQPLVEAHGHELSVSLPEQLVWVNADPTRLEQVLENLIDNAIRFTDPRGHIWVTAELQGAEVFIKVRDTGIGIAPSLLPRIFDLFEQGSPSLDRSPGGLGIGLALVQKVVQLHGGSVEASSAGLGKGSEFVVRLPALDGASLERQLPMTDSDEKSAARPLNILVVDDNVDAAESLALVLQQWGHTVHVANDGAEALEAAMLHRPETVVLDIGLPGMDGFQVAEEMRRRPELAGVVLVAMTGYGQTEDRRRSREAGFDHHLVKPVEPSALQELLVHSKSARRRASNR
ncbi:MAG: PAS domain S-box protein [Planctomycetes bacterium]|nr:PAS domain S-box protein [Planctomycetota bacterium]